MEKTELRASPEVQFKKPAIYERKGKLKATEVPYFDAFEYLLRTYGIARKTTGPGPHDKDVETMLGVTCNFDGQAKTFIISQHTIEAKTEDVVSVNITETTEGTENPTVIDFKKSVDSTTNDRGFLRVSSENMSWFNTSHNERSYRKLLKTLRGAKADLSTTTELERAFLERTNGRKDYVAQGRHVIIAPALAIGEPSISASGYGIIRRKDANTRKRPSWWKKSLGKITKR